MILDKLWEFDPAGTAITASAPSTNVVDQGVLRDVAVDGELAVIVAVTSQLLSAGATTLVVALQGSTDNVTWETMQQTGSIPKANLVTGAKFSLPFPRLYPGQNKPRYYRVSYTVGTGPFTGGTIASYLVIDDHLNVGIAAYGYPPGLVINN